MPRPALLLALALSASPAFAKQAPDAAGPPSPTVSWEVCNETSFVLRKASAFIRDGRMTAQGWHELLPGSCQTLETPRGSPRFLYAESLDVHQGGIREWKGDTRLCVNDETGFTLDATQDCSADGLTSRAYFAVRPDEPVTTLVEPSDYGPSKAVIAAQQRLLRDAGYDMSRIDGMAGRRTSRLLRAFRNDAGLDGDADMPTLLRALLEAARTYKDTVGLEVCNESSAPVWTAVATRDGTNWRSRGWWIAEPGTCTRPLDRPLPGTDAHVFALQEGADGTDRKLQTAAATPAQFCIAESQFDAPGNTMCVERGYAVASFRAVPTEDSGARMRLTDADFAAPLPGGLRR